jgi:hypothetical protein
MLYRIPVLKNGISRSFTRPAMTANPGMFSGILAELAMSCSASRLPRDHGSFGEAEHVGALGVLGAAAFVGRELAVRIDLSLT